jgi:serine/threonine-protein phosphatase CPPED1
MRAFRIGLVAALLAAAWMVAPRAQAPQGQAAPFAPFFFVQITDPQLGMYTKDADFAQETANLEFAVATINRLRPAFVVVTGDLINKTGDPVQGQAYLRTLEKIDRAIPVHNLPGNHDVGNEPTPESVAAYVKRFGDDFYSFRLPGFVGIVLDSGLVHAPQKAQDLAARQEQWLRTELARARAEHPRHIVVFQHHPLFLKEAAEADSYDVIPLARRSLFLGLFHEAGVHYVFGGHYHQNAVARDGDLEVVTTGPIGMPLRGAKSGLRVAVVGTPGIEHRYYELGELPSAVVLPK